MSKKHIAILGAGHAGLEAALTAARQTDRVTLISDRDPGDWIKMLPSRSWLAAIEQSLSSTRPPFSDGESTPEPIETDILFENIRRTTASWNAGIQGQISDAGITVVSGRGSFVSESTLRVSDESTGEEVTADAFVVCAGSKPFFPPGFEPDGKQVFSSGTAELLTNIPKTMIAVGDGAVGFEFVDIFSFLGVSMVWVGPPAGPQSRFDAKADELLLDVYRKRGVEIVGKPFARELVRSDDGILLRFEDDTELKAETAHINFGHRPATQDIDLESAGVACNERGQPTVNAYGQTSQSHIYLAGDVSGAPSATSGLIQGNLAVRHVLGLKVDPFDFSKTPYCFDLNPQVVRIGNIEDESLNTCEAPYSACLVSHVNFDRGGFVRICWNDEGQVVAGVAAGRNATEALAGVSMAVQGRIVAGGTSRYDGTTSDVW